MKISGTRSGALLSVLTLCCLGIIRVAEGSVLQSLLYIPDEEPDCSLQCRNLHRSYWPRCCETHNACCQEFVNDCVEDCRPRVTPVKGDLMIAEERPGMCCYMYNLCCTLEVFRTDPIVRGPVEPVKLPIVHRFSGGSADFHSNSGKRLSVEEEQALREKEEVEAAKRKLLNRRGNSPSSPRNVATRVPLPEGVQRVANLRLGGVNTKRVNLPAKQQPQEEQEREPTRPRSNPRRLVLRDRPKPSDREENKREREDTNRNRPETAPARQGLASIRQNVRGNVRPEQENVGERRANINTIPNNGYIAQEENVDLAQEEAGPTPEESIPLQENQPAAREYVEIKRARPAPGETFAEESAPVQENRPVAREYVEINRARPAPEEVDTQRQNDELAQDSIAARSETVVDPGKDSPNVIQNDEQVR